MPKGELYIVATPIGNLEDITLRAIRILNGVDLILAEDTRRIRKLLSNYDIHTTVLSFYQRMEYRRVKSVLKRLENGESVALTSNAGTPCISDPGLRLVNQAIKGEIKVMAVPGPSAISAALSISGLPLSDFTFTGFLPRSSKRRLKRLKSLKEEGRTVVIFESPMRLISLLKCISTVYGQCEVFLAREMTKMHEECLKGSPLDLLNRLDDSRLKGEVTVVVSP